MIDYIAYMESVKRRVNGSVTDEDIQAFCEINSSFCFKEAKEIFKSYKRFNRC